MVVSLLSTKYGIPPAGSNRVERPALLEKLDGGLQEGKRLILVCAPAGYGKTTLVVDWIHRITSPDRAAGGRAAQEPYRAAWLTCEPADDDLGRFLAYLAAALQQVSPRTGEGLRNSFHASRLPKAEALAALLINDLAELPGGLVLALDDFHTISSPLILDFLTCLIDHQPPRMRTVILTRADPALPLARLRGRGQLEEIRQKELAFSLDESEAFLAQTMGVRLTREQVERLEKRTEGWAAGLQLAALSLQSARDASAYIESFSGGHAYIADYLAEEVLTQQTEAVKNFLLQTAILERLSAPLCAAVTGDANAPEILEMLREKNLFLIALDHERTWYRYHPLFADLLRSRLHRLPGSPALEMHRRACHWYLENGPVQPAIEHALAAQETGTAAGLIEQEAEQVFINGQAATLLRWLEALPDEARSRHPGLWIFQGLALIWCGRPARAIKDALPGLLPLFQAAGLQGEASTLQALFAMMDGDAAGAARLAEKALEQLPGERALLRCLAADALGMAKIMHSDSAGAIRAFEQVVETAGQAGYVMFEILALAHLAGLRMQEGRLRTAKMEYEHALSLATAKIGRRAPSIGNVLLGLGELAREWGDFDEALGFFQEAAQMFAQLADVGVPIAYLSIARLKAAQKDWQAGQEMLDRARQHAQDSKITRMNDRLIDTLQARFWIERGEPGLADAWAREKGLYEHSIQEIIQRAGLKAAANEFAQSDYLTLARLYAAQGKPEAALRELEGLEAAARAVGSMRRVISILIVKALALQQKKTPDAAVDALGQALALAEPEAYRQVFLDEGEAVAPLLYQAARRGYCPDYACRLLAASEQEKCEVAGPETSTPDGRLVEPLSEREQEVLELIAAGLSNGEIGARLHITLSTVKGHAASIYGKLGVNSRTRAVSEAVRLGILKSGASGKTLPQ